MDTTVIFLAAVVLIVWNIIVFAMYAADKRKAAKNKWRISEATLIACAFVMGGIGALFGMRILRHKTQHLKFKLLIPLALVLNVAVVVLLVILIR
jgi:uncharacterized membrane protein YsdA (DUF1294 family)